MSKIVVITKQGNWAKTLEPVKTQQEISDALGHSDFIYAVTDYDKRPF